MGLLQQFENTSYDTTKVRVLSGLSWCPIIPRDRAKIYAHDALSIAENNGYQFGIDNLFTKPSEVEHHTLKATEIYRKRNNDS
ncbi:hypothetical protein JMN32_22210 [Fulvivirga sp. 29W222]|uniref:Uncharacterized protein n=1 Tax=Fulvivirga marina TaxID=2494733 RepID=A0A937KDV4_9BACT|nr:hypothetical protein [Fulvivirga marina]MBL6449042.1 hypothetical protein [Fulvivirga marina]